MNVSAVIWDFDGTLADTLEINLRITRRIVEHLLGAPAERFPALRDRGSYGRAVHDAANWRALYENEFDLPYERTHEAAPLWTQLHAEEIGVPPLFEGIREVVHALRERPQGIVSQNGRSNIEEALGPADLLHHFQSIVADEDLPFERQKPEPDGLLHCAEALHNGLSSSEPGTVLYVGDHPVDVECVRRAARRLREDEADWQVLSIGVEYGMGGERSWASEPDYRAHDPGDVLEIVHRLDRS